MKNKVKLKYCGFTNLEDAINAVNLNIDYIGFILNFPNKRSISLQKFKEISKILKNYIQAHKYQTKICAVVVDESEDFLNQIINIKTASIIQLHGKEEADLLKKMHHRIRFLKTFIPPKHIKNLKEFTKLLNNYSPYLHFPIFDATPIKDKKKHLKNSFKNLTTIAELEKNFPVYGIAGGINKDNIYNYLTSLNPRVIDISSGIEKSIGEKDKNIMKDIKNIILDYNNKS